MPRAALERRMATGEIEARSKNNKFYAEGYAAVFERRSGNLGGFVEVVKPTAFNKTIKEADVRALWNHDPSLVLGRNKLAGTLELALDSRGLHYRTELPNTTYARDLYELLQRRDITQSSFTFFKILDDWELVNMDNEEYPQRSLIEVGLVDVSPVTFPAYEDATSGPARRAAFDGLAKRSAIDIDFFVERADVVDIKRVIQELKQPDSVEIPEPRESTQDDIEERKSTAPATKSRRLSKEERERLLKESLAITDDEYSKQIEALSK